MQHRYHQQISSAERTVEPVVVTEAAGEFAEPLADIFIDHRQALFVPALVALQKSGNRAVNDWRLHRVERGEHPGYRPCPRIHIPRQQAGIALRDVENDRAGFEQYEVALLIGRDLSEWLKCQMRRFPHRLEGEKANIVGQPRFLQRPADAHVAGQTLAAIGRAFKSGNRDRHCCSPSRLFGDYWLIVVEHQLFAPAGKGSASE